MEYRTPPGTELAMPRLMLRTMTFGAQVDRAGVATMVVRCREVGVTMIDTANSWSRGLPADARGGGGAFPRRSDHRQQGF